MAMKKGYFFTLDALLALFMLAGGLIILSDIYTTSQPTVQIGYYSEDIISLLAETGVDELDNPLLLELIANENITDMQNTILEQIGIFWATNKTGLAINLSRNISADLIPERFGFAFVVGGETVYAEPKSTMGQLSTYKSMITGIEKNQPIKGTAARIYLQQIAQALSTKYAFLGGFVGQGNVTIYIKDVPADANFTELILEADTGDNFSLYINDVLCDNMTVPGFNLTSYYWDISFCNSSIITGGDNNFTFVFDGEINRSFIGGGFLKLSYYSNNIVLQNTSSHVYEFPGIQGIVNLYDGFDIPGTLNNMEIYMHYFANHSNVSNNTFYVTIGNDIVYRDNYSNVTMAVLLNNSYLSSQLDYLNISNQTVPLRVGFENISFEFVITDKGNGDVVAITDVSGSMQWEFDSNNNGIERFCKDPDLNDEDTMRLAIAKCVLKDFTHDILYNITGNRVGLVTYASGVRDSIGMQTNLTRLIDASSEYYASGATCTSCGVVEAALTLQATDPVDMLSKTWWYTNDYQSADPANWSDIDFDDSTWDFGFQKFGFGIGSEHYSGNVLQANLWDFPGDEPAPIDFTRGIYFRYNTFGINTTNESEYILTNQFFDGPSLATWSQFGDVALSETTIIFEDDFNDGDLTGWTPDPGRCSWAVWLVPDAHIDAQSTLSSGSYGARMRCGEDNDNSAGSGTTDNRDPWLNLALDLSSYASARVTYSRAAYAQGADRHEPGEDFRFEWTTNNYGATNQLENIEIRNNLEDANGDPVWQRQSYILPGTAMSSNFEMRYSVDGSWDGEHGYVDDVVVERIGSDIFGLEHFWMVNSSIGNIGYLGQQFSSPSDSPTVATLGIVHSINYSYFAGAADVFCNLTHPGGEAVVWTEHWDGGSLPAEGPILEQIDIAPLLTSDAFTYYLECGANVSGANTVVAFDNITIFINWTNNGDDGWDWQQGVYGYGANMDFFINDSKEIELAADRTAADTSGSYGIQVLVTQDMINAMNSPGGEAWLSFDYRWDPRDNGGGVFEDTDQVWIKGYWESQASGLHYLGTETNNEGGDSTVEIWSANDPDTEGSGHYSADISGWIDNGAGYYYLALGGKLLRSQSTEFGMFNFDNIQLAFTNQSGNTFYRNEFYISDISELYNPVNLTITSDSGADVYLNGNLLDSYVGTSTFRSVNVVPGDFVEGDNVLSVKLKNADAMGRLYVEFLANITNRQKAMVIMSDGESNDCVGINGAGTDGSCNDCGGRGCCPGSDGIINDPCPSIGAFGACGWSNEYRYSAEQLVNLSCYYAQRQNMSIYSVAFGDVAACGKLALNLSALCDPDYTPLEPHYFESDDPEGLSHIYGHIANELRLSFSIKKSQIISFEGDFEKSILYPDSYIYLNYSPIVEPMIHGEVPLYFESPDFGGCVLNFTIPNQIRILEANLLSYSGEHWTDFVSVNNSLGTFIAYNLSQFSDYYANLGDPFPIPIPGSFIASGENNIITVRIGDNPNNSSNCSRNTTLLYTGLINMVNYTLPYSTVHPNATGCNWTIEHELGYNFSILVPKDYIYSGQCTYTNTTHDTSGFDNDDAFNWAMYNFLSHMDYNNDGRIFLNLDAEDFNVNSRVIRDVPYLWGPTIAEVRVWQ